MGEWRLVVRSILSTARQITIFGWLHCGSLRNTLGHPNHAQLHFHWRICFDTGCYAPLLCGVVLTRRPIGTEHAVSPWRTFCTVAHCKLTGLSPFRASER